MLEIQKPDLTTTDAGLTMPLKKALLGYSITKLSSMTFNKLVGKECLAAIKDLKVDYEMNLSSTIAQFNIGEAQIKTFLPNEFTIQMKANLIKSGVEMHLGISEETPLSTFLLDGTDSLETKPEGADAAHKNIEEEVTGITSVSYLKDAINFYEPVRSTSPQARYVFVAREKNGAGKLAIRIKGDKCSVRVEPLTPEMSNNIDILGLNNNGDYASGHFDMGGSHSMKRYWAMLKASLETWEVAKFNEAKIRDIGV